jgi:DNA-binding response OmpR family regulator
MTARVLIVSTIFSKAKLLERALLDAHFAVALATSGADGLALCRQERADIVILEGQQPGLDGFAFCREIKADPALRHIAIGLIAEEREPWQRFLALEAQADECISSPIRDRAFLNCIRNLADLSESETRLRRAHATGAVLPDCGATRILVLDPDPASRGRLEEILSAGFNVVTSGRAEDAIACMAQETFGIVIADWTNMRNIGPAGTVLMQHLRIAGLSGRIRLLGIGDGLGEEGPEVGEGILQRPIDRNETLLRVRIAARKQAFALALQDMDRSAETIARQPDRTELGPPGRMAA